MTKREFAIMLNINTNLKKLTAIILMTLVGAALFAAMAPTIHAQSSADSAKSAACSKKSGQEEGACNFGFDGGYENPKTKSETICDKYHVQDNNDACVDGVKAGRAFNEKETKDAGNKVVLKDGTDPSITPCGKGDDAINLRFDLGCQGQYYTGPGGAIGDLFFSIIRFLSYGVGIAVVIAIIASGIQYTTSEGNPEATQAAKNRIQMSIISLIIYVFVFSIAQFLIPGGLFT